MVKLEENASGEDSLNIERSTIVKLEENASGEDSLNIDWTSEDERDIEREINNYRNASISSLIAAPASGPVLKAGEEENASGEYSLNIDWTSEDDRDIDNFGNASNSSSIAAPVRGPVANAGKASSSNAFRSETFCRFIRMGFPDKLVAKVIEENGEGNSELILNTLLTYSHLEDPPTSQDLEKSPQQLDVDCDLSSDYFEDVEESDSLSEDEENGSASSDKDNRLLSLENMGYTVEEAWIAIERCGPNASILELKDFLFAAQMSKDQDVSFPEEEKPKRNLYCVVGRNKKQKLLGRELKKKKYAVLNKSDKICLPKPMIGFGVPNESCPTFRRHLPKAAIGPPYFYYENVALTPKGEWDRIKSFLYDVEPEFVDSKFLCAAARKRGYIHNLPIDNRFPVLPLPPRTIQEAFPMTKKWWPRWDTRTKLNCLQTCIGSAKLTERIRKSLEGYDEPPPDVQKYVLEQCKKWNLVWVGRNKLAPLECDEVEMLLGFPKNHTRGGGVSRTDRYKSLGNSFQVDTVAYHLSVLKDLYPEGLNVLSLFSGIGGAEVALYRLGIPLRNVVSVEKSEVNRNIVRGFWEQTNQRGTLIDFDDVLKLHKERLGQVMNHIGGFDLVIGGSPCNNLAGSNRHHRDGLEGKESSLFFEYFRILNAVKEITGEMNEAKKSS